METQLDGDGGDKKIFDDQTAKKGFPQYDSYVRNDSV
jgi:hypothetical protein